MLRISRSLFVVSSAFLLAACSSASNGNNQQPVGDGDSGTGGGNDTALACGTVGAACTNAAGKASICQGDGSCWCSDGDDNDACNTLNTDGVQTYECRHNVCDVAYPAGPYGIKPGNIFPNIGFQGYKNGDNSDPANWGDLSMVDYYDPTGSKGITGIYLVIAAQWCGPCNEEADHLPKWFKTDYSGRGGQFVSIVYQQQNGSQATQLTTDQWIGKHKINFDIGIDPKNQEIPTGSFGLPHNYIIDPRTMKVYKTVDGIDPAITTGCTTSSTCCDPASSPTVCSVKYECGVNLQTCLPPGSTGPLKELEYIMKQNGATEFDLGLTP
jgi:hypothetical protein